MLPAGSMMAAHGCGARAGGGTGADSDGPRAGPVQEVMAGTLF